MPAFLPKSVSGLTGQRRWFGLDLAKRESQLAVIDERGDEVASKRFRTTRENVLALAAELTETDTIAFEVTTNAFSIARLLKTQCRARVIVSNPIQTKLIAKAKIKTDKIDARALGRLARADYLPEVWLPDPDTENLRQLFTDRRSLVDRRTELKNTVHSVLHRNLVHIAQTDIFGPGGRTELESIVKGESASPIDELDRLRLGSLLAEIDRQDILVRDQDAVIASFVGTRPEMRRRLDQLVSIPGISMVVGAGILAGIGDIGRFASPKKLACYFGLVPSTSQSGDKEARHGRITKQGRAEARWLLTEAAEHLRRVPGPMRALYARVHKQRGHNVAVVAVARKLAELIWHLLTKNRDYLYAVPKRTIDKRSGWRLMAKRRAGVELASFSKRTEGRNVLYGTGEAGTKLKKEIVRHAAARAERLYTALVEGRKTADKESGGLRSEDLVFDPLRPVQNDWEKILADVAGKLIAKRRKPAA